MRKKLSVLLVVACVLAVALTASGPVLAAGGGQSGSGNGQSHAYGRFNDVAGNHWALRDIALMEAKGVFGGYGNGQFGPQDPVTNIQLILLTVRLTGGEAAAGGMPLDQVGARLGGGWLDPADPPPTWAGVRECLAYAYENGYLNGFIVQEREMFRPNDPATRLEVIVTLLDALGLADAAASLAGETIVAPDADTVPAWAIGYVALAMDMGLLKGDESGALNLAASVTRAQMAALLRRADDKFESCVDDSVIRGELISVTTGDAPSITMSVRAGELRDYVEDTDEDTEDTDGGVADCVDDGVDGRTLVEVTFPVSADAPIFRDDVPATLADLVAGDELKVRVVDGIAVLIDAATPDSDGDVESDLEVEGPFVAAEYTDSVLTSITIMVVSIGGADVDEGDGEDEDNTSGGPSGQQGEGSGPELGAETTFAVSPDVVIEGAADGEITFTAGDFLTLGLLDDQVVVIESGRGAEGDEEGSYQNRNRYRYGVDVDLTATFDAATADEVTFTITVIKKGEHAPADFEIGAQLTLPVADDLEITGPDGEELTLADLTSGLTIIIEIEDGVITSISLEDEEEDEEEDD